MAGLPVNLLFLDAATVDYQELVGRRAMEGRGQPSVSSRHPACPRLASTGPGHHRHDRHGSARGCSADGGPAGVAVHTGFRASSPVFTPI